MSASNFHAVPRVPDSVAHLDPDVVVEVLSRHAVNVSDAAAELGVASVDLRRLLLARPQLTDAAVELEERRLDLAEKTFTKPCAAMTAAAGTRRVSLWSGTAIALAGAAGSRRAPALQSFPSARALMARAKSGFAGGVTATTSATPTRPRPSSCAMGGESTWPALDGATTVSSSNTRSTQRLRPRTKILATA